jgi:SAM-dependent methyltransferase
MSDRDLSARVAAVGFDPRTIDMEPVLSCNLCESRRFCVLARRDRYGFDLHSNLCLDCGLVFLSPRPTAQEYQRFYEDFYRPLVSAYSNRHINHLTIQEEQQWYASDLLKFLLPHLNGADIRRVLDIGGSTGVVAQPIAQALNCHGAVLDPSPQELGEASDKGLETICGLLEDYAPSSGDRWDLILMCRTVDHLLDIRGALDKIHTILQEEGLFFLDILDFRALYLRNDSIEAALKIDHPYYLIRETMESYFRLTGFRVVSMTLGRVSVGYLCIKAPPLAPSQAIKTDVNRFLWEIRAVQARAGLPLSFGEKVLASCRKSRFFQNVKEKLPKPVVKMVKKMIGGGQ